MRKYVNFPLKLIVVLALALTTRQGLAQQWMWESGAQTSDGSVQVQPMNGGSAMALPQNPTGTSAMTSMSALTQPPTVLNAMATLPIVQEHTACERTATEGDTAAVNADRTLLLTCRPNPEVAGSPLQWMRPNPPIVVEGQACLSPNGQRLEDGAIGKTSTGLILSCQSGMWAGYEKTQGALCGFSSDDDLYGNINIYLCKGHNPYISCPEGYQRSLIFQAWMNYLYSCVVIDALTNG